MDSEENNLMTSRQRIEFYQQRAKNFDAQQQKLQRKIRTMGWGRLVCFILGAGLVYYAFTWQPVWTLVPLVLFGGCFIYLVNLDKQWQSQKARLATLVLINEQEAKALAGDYSQFHNGLHFLDPQHAYANDLDIFGDGSIFQYLNRTSSPQGRQVLANWLTAPSKDIDTIERRQNAVSELSEKTDFLQDFRTAGHGLEESEKEQEGLEEWLNQESRYSRSTFYRILLIAMPVLTISMIIITVTGLITPLQFLFYLAVPLAVAGYHFKSGTIEQGLLSNNINFLQNHAWQLAEVEQLKADNEYLNELQATVRGNGKSASGAINQLAKLLDALDNRQNLLAGFMLNILLLWDLQCIVRLEKWREDNRDKVPEWFNSLHNIEALTSMAVFRYNHYDFTMPVIRHDKPVLEAKGLGHPLLAEEERVVNDFTMADNGTVIIITGANMAGKSTFLRSVGVSLVLAMAGAPVCAEHFECEPFRVHTSMRTTDSLLDHESHFYAELKRLHRIVEELHEGMRIFVILDELLRGTNTTDQHKGAKALIEQIVELNGTGLIATHDLKLGELANVYEGHVYNMCFEVKADGDKLHYDYKLQEGISQNMNATHLMKKMGIIGQNEPTV